MYIYTEGEYIIFYEIVKVGVGNVKIMVLGAIIAILLAPTSFVVLENVILNELNNEEELCAEIDEIAPVSTMKAYPRVIIYPSNAYYDMLSDPLCLPTVFLTWGGVDDPEGSGVQSYDVQFMRQYIHLDPDNIYAYVMPYWCDWQMNTTNTSAMYCPRYGTITYLRCRARDNVRNEEEWPLFFDTSVICLSVNLPPDEIPRLQDELEAWQESIDNRLGSHLEELTGRIQCHTYDH